MFTSKVQFYAIMGRKRSSSSSWPHWPKAAMDYLAIHGSHLVEPFGRGDGQGWECMGTSILYERLIFDFYICTISREIFKTEYYVCSIWIWKYNFLGLLWSEFDAVEEESAITDEWMETVWCNIETNFFGYFKWIRPKKIRIFKCLNQVRCLMVRTCVHF